MVVVVLASFCGATQGGGCPPARYSSVQLESCRLIPVRARVGQDITCTILIGTLFSDRDQCLAIYNTCGRIRTVIELGLFDYGITLI